VHPIENCATNLYYKKDPKQLKVTFIKKKHPYPHNDPTCQSPDFGLEGETDGFPTFRDVSAQTRKFFSPALVLTRPRTHHR